MPELPTGRVLRPAELESGQLRFTMLETIREFAVERLALSGEEDDVRRNETAVAHASEDSG